MTDKPAATARALAFDSGPRGFAWAVVDETRRGNRSTFKRIDTGDFTAAKGFSGGRTAIRELVERFTPAHIGVEGVAGFLSAARQKRQRTASWDLSDLVDTAIWSGFICGNVPHPSSVTLMPANNKGRNPHSWRFQLTGTPTAGDAEVLNALNVVIVGGLPILATKQVVSKITGRKQPQISYRDNNHKRDALGLAVVTLMLRTT